MKSRIETIGKLKCRILDDLSPSESPTLVVVLCHGYGAPGSDLVSIGEDILEQFDELQPKLLFVFPEAPLSLENFGNSGGRAWWRLDLMKLQIAAATGQFRDLRAEQPEGLSAARDLLSETLKRCSEKTGVPLSRFVIGGFSQGAMLTTDVALHLDNNVASLIVMSGSLLNEAEWRERTPHHAGLQVLQSHGHQDPLLPFTAAEWLRDLLVESGAVVDFIPFDGGHQIPWEVFTKLVTKLRELS